MAETNPFSELRPAKDAHEHGEKVATLMRDPVASRNFYADAIAQLMGSRPDIDDVSRRVQLARVVRDYGFSYVREALNKGRGADGEVLSDGLGKLSTSHSLLDIIRDQNHEGLSDKEIAAWHTERGLTYSAMGRLATAAHVLKVPLKLEPMGQYEAAHSHLTVRAGISRLAEAMNAVFAARQLVVEGSGRQNVRLWTSCADVAIQRALESGELEPENSTEEFDKRRAYLRSKKVATESVFGDP